MLKDKNKALTPLEELGEFGLIDTLTKGFKNSNTSTKVGVGDDAAVIDNKDFQTLVSTDLLVEGVHFDITYTPLQHLGYKAVVVNLSDIYAMNGTPQQVTVSLAISSRYTVEALEDLYIGIKRACDFYNVDLVGGDTTSSLSGLVISVTAIGQAAKDKVTLRSGAHENDLICVTGDLGAAYMGLQVLEREKSIFRENPEIQPDLSGYDYVLERQLKPEARRDAVKLLNDANIVPNAMIDISDGLASELMHLSKQSGVGVQVYEDKIPLDPETLKTADDFNLNAIVAALNGGEDYELLFTISQNAYEKIKNLRGIATIGHVTDLASGVNMVTNTGQQVPLQAQGWDALKG